MSDDAKHRPLDVESDSSGSDGATTPRQKLWVTPKVITSTLPDNTGHAPFDLTDGGGGTTAFS